MGIFAICIVQYINKNYLQRIKNIALFFVFLGQQIEVQYIADENGFQPSGPYVHPAIQKAVALQVAEAKAQAGLPPNGNGGIPRPFPPPFPSPFPSPLPYRPARR